jgi:hypothetical protein
MYSYISRKLFQEMCGCKAILSTLILLSLESNKITSINLVDVKKWGSLISVCNAQRVPKRLMS